MERSRPETISKPRLSTMASTQEATMFDTDIDADPTLATGAGLPIERWFVRCVWACACLAPAWAVLGSGL